MRYRRAHRSFVPICLPDATFLCVQIHVLCVRCSCACPYYGCSNICLFEVDALCVQTIILFYLCTHAHAQAHINRQIINQIHYLVCVFFFFVSVWQVLHTSHSTLDRTCSDSVVSLRCRKSTSDLTNVNDNNGTPVVTAQHRRRGSSKVRLACVRQASDLLNNEFTERKEQNASIFKWEIFFYF